MEENKCQVRIYVGQGRFVGEHISNEEAFEWMVNIAQVAHEGHKFAYFTEYGNDVPTLINLDKVSHVRVVRGLTQKGAVGLDGPTAPCYAKDTHQILGGDMFYEFRQNNSGGSFEIDSERGISVVVIVEADSADEANRRAETIGLYFDGEGDCSCCGDRWYEIWLNKEGSEFPSIYDKPLVEYGKKDFPYGVHSWAGSSPEAYVHTKDGRFFGFILTDNGQYVYDGDPSDLDAPDMPMLG